jgi:hypothetical protein
MESPSTIIPSSTASVVERCPLVLIEWEDSAQPVSDWLWLSHCDEFSCVICQSVGWLIHDGEDVKALAPNVGVWEHDKDAQVSGVIRIPARSIRKIVSLIGVRVTSTSEASVLSSRPG